LRRQENTLKPTDAPNPDNFLFDAYLKALKDAFGTEPWAMIEPYAQAVWGECRDADGQGWEAIRDRVRAEWP
jgi:hypothetical protein